MDDSLFMDTPFWDCSQGKAYFDWLQCNARYFSLPFIQKRLDDKKPLSPAQRDPSAHGPQEGLKIRGGEQKSVNLQYITLGCLNDGTNKSSTKRLMFQVIFFYTFYRLRALKTNYFYFCNFIRKKSKLIERIFAKNFARNHERK